MTSDLNIAQLRDLLDKRHECLNSWCNAASSFDAGLARSALAEIDETISQSLPALLDIAEDRNQLLCIIRDSFMTINDPTSRMAFDGKILVPHIEHAARYTEELRIERDHLLAKLERCETNLKAANQDCEWADNEISRLKDPSCVLLHDTEVVATKNEIEAAAKLRAAVALVTSSLRQWSDHSRGPGIYIHKDMLLQAIIEPLESAGKRNS